MPGGLLLAQRGLEPFRRQPGGVGGNRRCRVRAEQARDRRRGAPAHQIPQRDVDGGDALRERPRLAGLLGQHARLRRQVVERRVRRRERAPQQQRQHHGPHQRQPMFAAVRREIAVGLAPAAGAVAISDLHEQHAALVQPRERRDHRPRDRRAVQMDFGSRGAECQRRGPGGSARGGVGVGDHRRRLQSALRPASRTSLPQRWISSCTKRANAGCARLPGWIPIAW